MNKNKYLVFNRLKDAVRYRQIIGNAICRFAVNHCGYEAKTVHNQLEPLGKRLRHLVNDPYFKRHGKKRKNKASWRWKPDIYFACNPFVDYGKSYFLLRDFRWLVFKLILENRPDTKTKTIHKYFRRYLAIPTRTVPLTQFRDRKIHKVTNLSRFRRWFRYYTDYNMSKIEMCTLIKEMPSYKLETFTNWVEEKPDVRFRISCTLLGIYPEYQYNGKEIVLL